MIKRMTQMVLLPSPESDIFDERGFTITIVDDAGGEFVEVLNNDHKLCVDPFEWPELRDAIDSMIKECLK